MNTWNESSPTDQARDGHDDHQVNSGVASLPLGSVTGIQVSLSYSLLLATVVILGCAIFFSSRDGNSDLVQTALSGVAVWIAGLSIQFATAVGYAAIAGLRIRSIVIGLVGVELPVHRWSPHRTAILVIVCLQTLFVLGGGDVADRCHRFI